VVADQTEDTATVDATYNIKIQKGKTKTQQNNLQDTFTLEMVDGKWLISDSTFLENIAEISAQVPSSTIAPSASNNSLTNLVPSSANLVANGKLSKIINDKDINSLFSNIMDTLGAGADLDSLKQLAQDSLGIDIGSISDVQVFMASTTLEQDTPYLAIIAKGKVDQKAILSSMTESSGQEPDSVTYNGQTIYKTAEDEPEVVILGKDVVALGTEQALKDMIDTSSGSKPHISGSIADNYQATGNDLVRCAATIPDSLLKEATQGTEESPLELGPVLNVSLITLGIGKTGTNLTANVSIRYASAAEASQAGQVIETSLNMLKGLITPPDSAELTTTINGLFAKLKVNAASSNVNLALNITTSEISNLVKAISAYNAQNAD